MYAQVNRDLTLAFTRSLERCRKCFGKASIGEDCSAYAERDDFKISCEKEDVCKTDIQTNNSRILNSQEKYGSLRILVEKWNAENRMELEWFPERQKPSSSDLEKWDSQNSLRPSKQPARKTST